MCKRLFRKNRRAIVVVYYRPKKINIILFSEKVANKRSLRDS